MKVSVIVTTYNRPDALTRVISGLCRQGRPPDEILVADDGSGPVTRRALADVRIPPGVVMKHVWQADQGFRAARVRNKAVLQAGGDYLVFMDGDCIPNRHFVADHLALAEKGCFFQGKRVLVLRELAAEFDFQDTVVPGRLLGHALAGRLSNAHHILRLPILPGFRNRRMSGIRTCNMGCFRKDVVAVNGFSNGFTGWGREDSEFAARLFKYGLWRKEHSFMAVCYHLWHPESSRTDLERNDRLLEKTLAGQSWVCPDGLSQLSGEI